MDMTEGRSAYYVAEQSYLEKSVTIKRKVGRGNSALKDKCWINRILDGTKNECCKASNFGSNRDTLGSCFFLRTEITLKGATYQISFTDTDQLPPPFRIDNISEVNCTVFPIFHYWAGIQEQNWKNTRIVNQMSLLHEKSYFLIRLQFPFFIWMSSLWNEGWGSAAFTQLWRDQIQ